MENKDRLWPSQESSATSPTGADQTNPPTPTEPEISTATHKRKFLGVTIVIAAVLVATGGAAVIGQQYLKTALVGPFGDDRISIERGKEHTFELVDGQRNQVPGLKRVSILNREQGDAPEVLLEKQGHTGVALLRSDFPLGNTRVRVELVTNPRAPVFLYERRVKVVEMEEGSGGGPTIGPPAPTPSSTLEPSPTPTPTPTPEPSPEFSCLPAGLTPSTVPATHITYYDLENKLLKYAHRTTGDWNITTLVTDHSGINRIDVDTLGRLHIVHRKRSGELIYAVQNEPLGSDFISTVIAPQGFYSDFKLDDDGCAHVAFHAYPSEDEILYASNRSGDWTIATVADSNPIHYGRGRPSLDLDNQENVHIVFDNPGGLIHATKSFNETEWQQETITTGALGQASLEIDKSDNLYISFANAAEQRLKYITRPNGAAWTAVEDIDQLRGDRGSAQHSEMVVDEGGNAHITYQDWGPQNLEHAFKPAGQQQWELVTVDDLGSNGGGSRAVVDESNQVNVSYAAGQGPGYAYLPFGGEWVKEVIETFAEAGSYDIGTPSSIAVFPKTDF